MSSLSSCSGGGGGVSCGVPGAFPNHVAGNAPGGLGGTGEEGVLGNNNALSVTMTPPVSTKFAHNQRVAGGGKQGKGLFACWALRFSVASESTPTSFTASRDIVRTCCERSFSREKFVSCAHIKRYKRVTGAETRLDSDAVLTCFSLQRRFAFLPILLRIFQLE